jgi:hypothetical protein
MRGEGALRPSSDHSVTEREGRFGLNREVGQRWRESRTANYTSWIEIGEEETGIRMNSCEKGEISGAAKLTFHPVD